MLGASLRDHIRNEEITRIIAITYITERIQVTVGKQEKMDRQLKIIEGINLLQNTTTIK